MSKSKIIFDLDGTLLSSGYKEEKEYFDSLFGKDNKFTKNLPSYLMDYESRFSNYDYELLSKFLSDKSGYPITEDIIKEWVYINGNSKDTILEDVEDVLYYLKSKDKKIIVLSNWIGECQKNRLIHSNLDQYIDEVYGGELFLKPHREAFLNACGVTPTEECVMVGDDYIKDYLGGLSVGIESYYLEKGNEVFPDKGKIKRLGVLKERIK